MIQKMIGRDQIVWIVLVQERRAANAEISGTVADEDAYGKLDHSETSL